MDDPELFRVYRDEDRTRLETEGALLGVGVMFSGGSGLCVVEWNRDVFEEDDRLEFPHQSLYGSRADVEQGTGGVVVFEGEGLPEFEADVYAEPGVLDSGEWFEATKRPVTVQAQGLFHSPDVVETLEGDFEVDQQYIEAHGGYYVICGVQGELYPCGADVFEETYEVEDSS